jgi:hypothetical protein
MDHPDAHLDAESPLTIDASHARVRAVRDRLPGQLLRERLLMANLCYGPLYSLAEIRRKVGGLLPRRIGLIRGATLEPIQTFREVIPDEALLKYDDAARSGLFSKFWVAMPTYYRHERRMDPWIVAEVTGSDRWAVIAHWDA